MELHQTKKTVPSKRNYQQNKKAAYWEKILQMIYPPRGKYTKYTKNSYSSTSKNKQPHLKVGRGPEKIFFQRRHKMANRYMKNAQHHQSSRKCKSKPQRYHHTCQNGYHQKRKQIINVGENVEKRESLCTIGGNAN